MSKERERERVVIPEVRGTALLNQGANNNKAEAARHDFERDRAAGYQPVESSGGRTPAGSGYSSPDLYTGSREDSEAPKESIWKRELTIPQRAGIGLIFAGGAFGLLKYLQKKGYL